MLSNQKELKKKVPTSVLFFIGDRSVALWIKLSDAKSTLKSF